MCGIAGIHVKDRSIGRLPLERMANALLLGIENRGRHATGFVAVGKDGRVVLDKSNITATEFIKNRERLPANTKQLLLHTRHATKGDPKDMRNNHPVNVKSCFVTHNGQISNDDELFEELGEERRAAVDSIIVPTIVSKWGLATAPKKLIPIEGSYALAIIDPVECPDETLLVRGRNTPVVYVDTKHFIMWASTDTAIKDCWGQTFGTPPKWKHFHRLLEGEYFYIMPNDETRRDRYMTVSFAQRSGPAPTRQVVNAGSVREPIHTSDGVPINGWAGPMNVNCFECGRLPAITSIPDFFINETKRIRTEWDAPVCIPCYRLNKGVADNLTYEHSSVSLKIKTFSLDDEKEVQDKAMYNPAQEGKGSCALCHYFDARDGSTECRQCEGWEDRNKIVASYTADRADKIETIEPGAPIPEDVQDAFVSCEQCAVDETTYISKDGFPLCNTCHEMEVAEQRVADREQTNTICDVCNEVVPKVNCRSTVFGKICDECVDNADKPPNSEFDIACDGCGEAFPPDELSTFGEQTVCDDCFGIANGDEGDTAAETEPIPEEVIDKVWDAAIRDGDARVIRAIEDEKLEALMCGCGRAVRVMGKHKCMACYVDAGEAPSSTEVAVANPLDGWLRHAKTHMRLRGRACVEAALELDLPPHFVTWLLWEATEDELTDPVLAEKKAEVNQSFLGCLWMVEELVRNGRDDLLEVPAPLAENEDVLATILLTKEEREGNVPPIQ